MPDDPFLEPRRKLVCQTCGYWLHAADCYEVRCCGRVMVETYADQGLLTLDQALANTGSSIADLFRTIFRRWRHDDVRR